MNDEPRTLLVDGTFFLHRILHLPNFVAMQTSEGRRTGGVFGFINSLRVTLREFPTLNRCYVCWDNGRSDRRMGLLPAYKQNRELSEDASEAERREKEEYERLFVDQKKLVQQIIPSLGCRQLALPNREADDLIGWMTYKHPDPKVIATEDKDLYQLVYDWATVYRPIQKMKVTKEEFFAIVGHPQPLYLLYRALVGDKSDNIPGILGDTVATRLMGKVAELWKLVPDRKLSITLIEACDIMAEEDRRNRKKYQRVKESEDDVRLNLQMMDISQEVATFTEEESQKLQAVVESKPTYYNEEAFLPHIQALEFNSIIQDTISWTYRFRGLT